MIQFKNPSPRLLVVGDLMLDHYLWGACHRINPEAPVPVIDVAREDVRLGGAGNVANNLKALGAQVEIASVLGDDVSGREVLALLSQSGVAADAVVVEAHRQTSRKSRVIATQQQVVRFDQETRTPISANSQTTLVAIVAQRLAGYDAILLSDYDKGVLTPRLTQQIIALATDKKIPLLVDPKGRDFAKYRGATIITPNRKEAEQFAGIEILDEDSLRRVGATLQQTLGIQYALITLSQEGMALFDREMTRIPAMAREVFDVTGAGDTVLATLGFGLAAGLDMSDAAHLANTAAAIVVGKVGSATATLSEIAQFGDGLAPADSRQAVKSWDDIKETLLHLRSQGKTIVFTNGCYDLLHRGHVEHLRASRACGDVLIVGLNSDDSVRRLKGPERPVVKEQDRAHLLSALRFVDYVVIFNEDTPYDLIKLIRPDILTKSGDYTGKEVVGADLVKEVRLSPFIEGHSTTGTLQRMK